MANRILDTQRAGGGNAIFEAVGASATTQVNLIGVGTTQGATSGTGAVSVVPAAPGVVNLIGSSTTQGGVSGTGAASVAPGTKTINLVGSSSTQAAVSSTGAAQIVPSEEQIMTFTASVARTVSVGPGSKSFTAGELWNMSDPKKPRAPKDPDATTDFSFNWAPWLLDVADSIFDHDIVPTEGVTSIGAAVVGSVVTVFLSGGNPGKRAEVTCRITTNSVPRRIEDRTIFLDIESR